MKESDMGGSSSVAGRAILGSLLLLQHLALILLLLPLTSSGIYLHLLLQHLAPVLLLLLLPLTSSGIQGCDRRRYYVIYVNVLKIDVIYVIFDFEDVIRYFCQNMTLFLSK